MICNDRGLLVIMALSSLCYDGRWVLTRDVMHHTKLGRHSVVDELCSMMQLGFVEKKVENSDFNNFKWRLTIRGLKAVEVFTGNV